MAKRPRKRRASGTKFAERPDLTQKELAALDFIIKDREARGLVSLGLPDAEALAKAAMALVGFVVDLLFHQVIPVGGPSRTEQLSSAQMRAVEKLLAEMPSPSLEDLKKVRDLVNVKNAK